MLREASKVLFAASWYYVHKQSFKLHSRGLGDGSIKIVFCCASVSLYYMKSPVRWCTSVLVLVRHRQAHPWEPGDQPA